MSEANEEEDKTERRFSQEQYEMLLRCSKKKDMREWNEWRRKILFDEIKYVEILLEGANLRSAHLEGADFYDYKGQAHLKNVNLHKAHLVDAKLGRANLEDANLNYAQLANANLAGAHLKGASIRGAHLEKANLWHAHLENTNFMEACLQGADLRRANLQNANLGHAHLEDSDFREVNLKECYIGHANLKNANLSKVNLEIVRHLDRHLELSHIGNANQEGENLREADLKGAYLGYVGLEEANLCEACLEGAYIGHAHLEKANLEKARLANTYINYTYLENAKLNGANLENADLNYTHLNKAEFMYTNLKNINLCWGHLEGANFEMARVDGSTLIWGCEIDSDTYFSGVGLASVRTEPGTKQLLEYNIRRKNWEEWYKEHPRLKWLVRPFWQISDYGISTKQIIKTFFQWALIFAAVYLVWGLIDYHLVGLKDDPGIVSNLFVLEGEQEAVSPWLVPFRAVYFSIVTMTTLGFGDMYANAHGFLRGLFGHVLLASQVILGYVLLGALVTRFAVLFMAGGPAGKFAGEKKKSRTREDR